MTVVSVGHRPSLLQFHTHVLSCEKTADSSSVDGASEKQNDQPAQWVWQTVAEYRARTGL